MTQDQALDFWYNSMTPIQRYRLVMVNVPQTTSITKRFRNILKYIQANHGFLAEAVARGA